MSAAPLARAVALATFLTLVLTGGGRIAGSDEVTMFEVSRALLSGGIAVPEGATLRGPDGRYYSKNHAGQAVLALPIVAAGEAAARLSGAPAARQRLASRFVASFFNALLTACLAGAFVWLAVPLGVPPGAAAAAAAALVFTTPMWVYAKSFMAEPMQALGLLLAICGGALARESAGLPAGERRRAEWACGLGVLLAVSAKASMLLPAVAGVLATGLLREPGRRAPALGLAAALAGHLAYNLARFGDPFESGYGGQASLAAFSTPLLAGLHGLLFSSGKGLAWFAPLAWLVPWGWGAMRRARAHREAPRHAAAAAAAAGSIAACAAVLLQAATFQHWGGDGSWGPRYLVPVLPLLFVAVGFALVAASRARRRAAMVLAGLGLVVNLGGVGIYYGVQMRVAGDYPYTLPLEHPKSMESSHWNPRFSPIAAHWDLLTANLAAHLRGGWPRVAAAGGDARLGVSDEDQRALWGGIDLWWLYAAYAGVPFPPLAAAAAVLAIAAAAAWIRARGLLARGSAA